MSPDGRSIAAMPTRLESDASHAAVRSGPFQPALATFAAVLCVVFVLRVFLTVRPGGESVWKREFLKEHGLLERAEAVLWVPATVLHARLFAAAIRTAAGAAPVGWLGLQTFLCLFALGEETGWGQHVIGLEPNDWLLEHNVQQDVTLHNLDFVSLLGIPDEHPLASWIAWGINAAPYGLCVFLWIVLPLAARSGRVPWLRRLPLPGGGVVAFFATSVVLYVATDVLVADVAEVFELAIAMVFVLAALDVAAKLPAAARETEEPA